MCTGGNFSTVPVGFSESLVLNVFVRNDNSLVPDPVAGTPGATLHFESEITTTTPEVSTANNFSEDDVTVILSLSSIAGNVFADILQDQQFSPGQDIRLPSIQVCLQGQTNAGYSVGISGDVVVPCVQTDNLGAYSFVGLLPGDYTVNYVDNTSYDPSFSDAGVIASNTVGQGSLQGGSSLVTVNNITLGSNQHSTENNFGLIPTTCTTPINLAILSPGNNTNQASTSVTVQGSIDDLSASISVDGTVITTIDVSGNFSAVVNIVGSATSFVFSATNGDTTCDEQIVLTLNR